MIPETLQGWTLEAIETLLHQGVFESDRFDFKGMLPNAKADGDKLRLKKACAAFANSEGGFLIFGVKDEKGLSAADRLVGLDPTQDFPEQFGNYPSAAEPSLSGAWSFKNPPIALTNGRVVHVAYIPSSSRKPHGVFEDGRWWFCKRTNKGTESLSHAELLNAFSSTREKLAKLRMLITEIQYIRDRAQEVNARASQGQWTGTVPAYDYSVCAALVPDLLALLSQDDAILRILPDFRDAIRVAEEFRQDRSGMAISMVARNLQVFSRRVHHEADLLLPLLRKVEANA